MLINLLDNFHEPTPQVETGVCYASKVEKTEFLIDWSLSATQIERNIRAFEGCYFMLSGKRVKVLKARVLNGFYRNFRLKNICGRKMNEKLTKTGEKLL